MKIFACIRYFRTGNLVGLRQRGTEDSEAKLKQAKLKYRLSAPFRLYGVILSVLFNSRRLVRVPMMQSAYLEVPWLPSYLQPPTNFPHQR